ncbi:uridine kinase family protein [Jeotgalibacillus soli]|uniref:Phosphoribulokinase/uridine kinase domain-containing protein n=1 Tax=Jeotgalibacillus soli TaxID=889306 RepID=A0A0C2W7U3_9BACL|nr:hypothetical protein [Jeotgalibacillus soli]KIL52088.1 hypothetical protein KP78_04580 [Jeotgalibacillus soli]
MTNTHYFSNKKEASWINQIKQQAESNEIVLIGIDGGGGAGKSTFARKIQEQINDVTIIHKDDFYLSKGREMKENPELQPIGADYDWRRLEEQVLKPLSNGHFARYQRYDWDFDKLAEWYEVKASGVIVVEGVYATRPELHVYYDWTVWIDTPKLTRLNRGIERDGEQARSMWELYWMKQEDRYFEQIRPFEKVDLRISGQDD